MFVANKVEILPLNKIARLCTSQSWQPLSNTRKLLGAGFDFLYPEGTSGGILKSNGPSVHLSVRPSVTNRVSAISHKLLKQI